MIKSCLSGSPVLVAANLFFPGAGYVPFVDLGVFAVVLDTAGVFAVEFSPVKVDVGVIGFLGDFDTGIGVGAVLGSAVEFHIFCLQGGVVRVVRYHELAVVAAKLRALEFKTCAVAEGEQKQHKIQCLFLPEVVFQHFKKHSLPPLKI